MSINIGDNFSYLGKKFLDDREHFDTVVKMKACNDVPNGFITYCDETNTRYEYHTDNEEDATLGKWRVFKSVPDVNFDEYVTQDELEEAIKDVDVTSQLENYATKEYVDEVIDGVDVTEQLQDYAKKSDIPSVPTKVSELENDSGYLTEHQSLEGLASETYVDNKVSNLVNSAPETLDTLNEVGIQCIKMQSIDKSTSKYVSVNSWDEILEYFKLLIERGEHYGRINEGL